MLREKGLIENPLAANLKPGYDIAAEFVNMYLGYGGEFFEPGTANLAINNEKGIAALETLKSMTAYMDPDFMTYNTNAIKPIWEAGQVAIINAWGSRAAALIDAEGTSSRDRRELGARQRADGRRRHHPGGDALVGRLRHRQEHLRRGRRGLVPRNGPRHPPRGGAGARRR